MSIALDHTVVPAKDRDESARFFARIFGLNYESTGGYFAQVHVNDTLTLDFADETKFDRLHYAFKTSEAEFDEIIARLKADKAAFGSGPGSPEDLKIGRRNGGKNCYFRDPSGHLLQILTA